MTVIQMPSEATAWMRARGGAATPASLAAALRHTPKWNCAALAPAAAISSS